MRDSLLLIAAALAAFGLSLGGVFHFDDYALFNNADVTAWSATRPLTNLTFYFNGWLGGRSNPAAYHAVNLLLHLASVLLLRATLTRLVTAPVALIAALLFAVHPLQGEPVNYVFARGTLLATLLCIASFRSWLDGRQWIAVLWFAAALLAKEECVAFPAFLGLLNLAGRRPRSEWRPIAAMLLITLAAGLRVIWATSQSHAAGSGFGSHVAPLEYLSMQGIAILHYLRLFLLPWGFTIDTDLGAPSNALRLLAWLAVLLCAGLCAAYSSRMRPGFWFLGGLILLLPSSSIFPADDFAADRRMYLPMIALSTGAALWLVRLDRRIVALLVLAAASISLRYTLIWQTERGLWTEAVLRSPNKTRPRLQLARTEPAPERALAILAGAQRITPNDPEIASEQGRMLLSLARPAEALSAFGRALALTPNDAAAISNRAVALEILGQREDARREFERALTKDPCQFNARLNLKRMGVTIPPLPRCRFTAEQESELLR